MDKINTDNLPKQEPALILPVPGVTSPTVTPEMVTQLQPTEAFATKQLTNTSPKDIKFTEGEVAARANPTGDWASAFNQHNATVNAYNWWAKGDPWAKKAEPGFSIFDHEDEIAGYEDYYDSLIKTRSYAEMKDKLYSISRERQEKVSADENWGKSAIAGLLDPIGWTVGALATGGIGLAGKAGLTANVVGRGVLGQAAKGAAVGAGQVAGTEAILQGTQDTRTLTESALYTGVGAVGGGALGAIGKLFKDSSYNQALRAAFKGEQDTGINVIRDPKILNEINNRIHSGTITNLEGIPVRPKPLNVVSVVESSPVNTQVIAETEVSRFVGNAMRATEDNEFTWIPEDTTVKGLGIFGKVAAVVNPSLNLLRSELPSVRKFTNELVDHAFELVGHSKGKVSRSLEGVIDFTSSTYKKNISDAVVEAEKGLKSAGVKMGHDDVSIAIQRAVITGEAEHPAIATAANKIRKVMDDIDGKMNVISKTTGVSYKNIFEPLLFNKAFVRNNSPEFVQEIRAKLKPFIEKMTAEQTSALEASLEKTNRRITGIASDDLADAWARRIYEDITSTDPKNFGVLKAERTTGVSKEIDVELPLEAKDFAKWYDGNLDGFTNKIIDRNVPRIEAYYKFGGYKFEDAIAPIRKEMEALKAANPQLSAELERGFKTELNQLKYMYDQIMNEPKFNSSVGNHISDGLLKLGSAQMLGSALLSSLTDSARMMFAGGVENVFSRNLSRHINVADLKASKTELKQISSLLEDVMNNRSNSMAGLIMRYADDGSKSAAFSNAMTSVSDFSMKASLLPYWTKVMKVESGYKIADKVFAGGDKLLTGKALTDKEVRYFSKMGLTNDDLTRIATHIKDEGKINFANWDEDLYKTFSTALIRKVDQTITTPKTGDLPQFMTQNPVGRFAFQFGSFAFAQFNQFIVPGLQRAEVEWLMTLGGIAALSYAQIQIKSVLNGSKVPETWKGNDGWAMKIIDDMGFVSPLTMVWDKAGGLVPPISRDSLLGVSQERRPQSIKERLADAAGPVGRTAENIVNLLEPLNEDKDFDARTLHSARALMPMQNLWYAKGILNRAEEAASNATGLDNMPTRKNDFYDWIKKTIGD